MKQFVSIIILISIAGFNLSAQSSNNVVFSFKHKAGNENLILNSTKFSIWNGKKVQLNRAEFYISEIVLKSNSGSDIPVTDQFILVNASNPNAEFNLDNWPVEEVKGLILHLGVPNNFNHLDPATYPPAHPLALKNPTMHWGWTAGYRFMAIEGKVDNNNDGVPETTFEFHNLGDALYKSLEVTGYEKADQGVLHIHLVIDYSKLFQNMTMTGNLIQHGSASINDKMMTNGATEQFITMDVVTGSKDINTENSKLEIYPNPANDHVVIKFDPNIYNNVKMIINNNLGQSLNINPELRADGYYLDTRSMSNGIYSVSIIEKTSNSLILKNSFVVNHR